MNAYCIAWHPDQFLIEPAPFDPDLDGLSMTLALEKCQRIMTGCYEAIKTATTKPREFPRLVIAR